MPRVAVHPGSASAQQERSTAGHAGDRSVEADHVARHVGHAELVGWARLIVGDHIAADHDDRNGGAWPLVVGDDVDLVARKVGDHLVAQAEVELDHLRWRPQRSGLPG